MKAELYIHASSEEINELKIHENEQKIESFSFSFPFNWFISFLQVHLGISSHLSSCRSKWNQLPHPVTTACAYIYDS